MTDYCIDYLPNGCIFQQRAGSALRPLPEFEMLPTDGPVLNLSSKFVFNGALTDLPEKPSEHHSFDYEKLVWEDKRRPESEWMLVRMERDRRLLASDWTQLPDVPLATKEAWATYRQALRDITEQPDPFNITWPAVPG